LARGSATVGASSSSFALGARTQRPQRRKFVGCVPSAFQNHEHWLISNPIHRYCGRRASPHLRVDRRLSFDTVLDWRKVVGVFRRCNILEACAGARALLRATGFARISRKRLVTPGVYECPPSPACRKSPAHEKKAGATRIKSRRGLNQSAHIPYGLAAAFAEPPLATRRQGRFARRAAQIPDHADGLPL
jgi:hypothetical protein